MCKGKEKTTNKKKEMNEFQIFFIFIKQILLISDKMCLTSDTSR